MYAIVNLIFENQSYLPGALCQLWVHKKLMPSGIKLVALVDEKILKSSKKILNDNYDYVFKVPLWDIPLHKNYKFRKDKYSWMSKSMTKWYCLQLTQFEKILFLDLDILPVSKDFYSVFNFKTPASHTMTNNFSKLEMINAGLVLLSPQEKEFEKFKHFVDRLFQQGAFSPVYRFGIDEFSLYKFYTKWTVIPSYWCMIPWHLPLFKDPHDKVLSYNFLSEVKPWNKIPPYIYPEEYLWTVIMKKLKISNKKYIDTERLEKLKYSQKELEGFGILILKDLKKFI